MVAGVGDTILLDTVMLSHDLTGTTTQLGVNFEGNQTASSPGDLEGAAGTVGNTYNTALNDTLVDGTTGAVTIDLQDINIQCDSLFRWFIESEADCQVDSLVVLLDGVQIRDFDGDGTDDYISDVDGANIFHQVSPGSHTISFAAINSNCESSEVVTYMYNAIIDDSTDPVVKLALFDGTNADMSMVAEIGSPVDTILNISVGSTTSCDTLLRFVFASFDSCGVVNNNLTSNVGLIDSISIDGGATFLALNNSNTFGASSNNISGAAVDGTVDATNPFGQDDLATPDDIVLISGNTATISFSAGPHSVVYKGLDFNGNESMATYNFTIQDGMPPMVACNATFNAVLDVSGNASISISDIQFGTATDDCSTPTVMFDPASQMMYDCDDASIGVPIMVNLIATDIGGNKDTCTTQVTVIDNIAPQITQCPDTTIFLGASCDITLVAPTLAELGATDNCGITASAQNPSISPSGLITVTRDSIFNVAVTVTDDNNQIATCTYLVVLRDTIPPSFTTPTPAIAEVYLDNNCQITVPSLANTITDFGDNCTPFNISQMPMGNTLLGINHNGMLDVVITATDLEGNISFDTVSYTVLDTLKPQAICPTTQSITLTLNPQDCNISLPDYASLGSGDNCGLNGAVIQTPPANSVITTDTMVTILVEDIAGLKDSCSFMIQVTENTDPLIVCPPDLTRSLTSNCDPYTVEDFTVLATTSDNCSVGSVADTLQSPMAGMTFSNDTTVTVTLTAVDNFGNSGSCSFTLSVSSNILPMVQDTTVQCQEAIINAPVAFFNCSNPVFGIPISGEINQGTVSAPFYIFQSNNLTARQITWIYPQQNNSSFTFQTITFGADMMDPMAECLPTKVISVDSFGMVVIDPMDIDNGSTDMCTPDSITLSTDITMVPCDSLGKTFTIKLFAEDAAGNIDSCTSDITIIDDIAPIFFGVPANDTIDCSASVPAQMAITPVDNCGMVVVDSTFMTMVSTQADTPSVAIPALDSTFYNYTVTYSWIAQDTAGNRDTAVQVIVVEDKAGPVINYPDTLIVAAMGTDCVGSAVLDLGASVADNCSDTLKVFQFSTTPTFAAATTTNIVDSNNVVTLDTIIGDTTVYIKATDFSNNTTIDTLTIMVMDQGAPIASCATSVSVSIGASGTLILVPADIDQNSRDACSPVTLTLSRDSFACADIDQTFPIILTTTDDAGNAASCTSMVTIQQGNSAPCGSGNNNPSCVGFNITSIVATAETAVGANDGTATVVAGGASGAFNYQWVLGNLIVGNTATITGLAPGTYSVTVTDQADANCTVSQTVIVPAATTTDPCAGFSIASITATAETAVGANDGTATVVGAGASAFTYQWVIGNTIVGNTGTIVGLAPGTYSVTITDQANANCTASQTVIVPAATNNDPCAGFSIASITATAETAVGANDGTATVVGAGASAFTYQWVIGNTIVGNTGTIVGLAPGTYSVTITDQANANCTASQTVIVPAATVVNPPTVPRPVEFILCDVAGAPGSIVQVPVKVVGFDNLTSFAMSYNLASTANAQFVTPNPIGSPAFTSISTGPNTSSRVNVIWVSPVGQTLADSSVIFTISMVLGANNATVPITIGGSGNATALEVAGIVNGQSIFLSSTGVGNNVTVGTGGGTINPPINPPVNDIALRGQITVEDLRGVEGATVNTIGGASTSTTTNTTGDYGITVPANTSITITPFEDDNHINGVNLGDMIRIARHIARIDFLDSPLQLIAADVNRDGRVNSRDRSEIFQIVLGRESRFDNNTSWRFIPKSHVFPASTLPPNGQPGLTYPESITVNSGAAGVDNLDFWAVKVGDVDSMAIVPFRNTPIATSRSREKIAFKVQDQLIEAGTRIAVPFKANQFNALLGYQMTIDGASALSLAKVESGALKVSMSNFYQNERQANQSSTVWYTPEAQTIVDDETLFTLYFDVQEDGQLSDLLAINSEFIEALAIDAQDNHLDIAIEFEGTLPVTEEVSTSFELYQNRPNPFRNTTTIGFNLPTRETATLRVFDLAGRQLHKVTQEYQKGYNEVSVNSSQWNAGVLYYELATDSQVARQKMILIE